MRRITVSLPEEVADVLADEARRLHRTVSDIVREAVTRQLELDEGSLRSVPFVGLFDSDELTPGSEVEAELERTWADALRDR